AVAEASGVVEVEWSDDRGAHGRATADLTGKAMVPRIVLAALSGMLALADPAARPRPPRSGVEFQGADGRAVQRDDFANPGMLWVARGEDLWRRPHGRAGASCAACHGDAAESMAGVAARYPAHSAELGRVVNLEQRINACVTMRQQ